MPPVVVPKASTPRTGQTNGLSTTTRPNISTQPPVTNKTPYCTTQVLTPNSTTSKRLSSNSASLCLRTLPTTPRTVVEPSTPQGAIPKRGRSHSPPDNDVRKNCGTPQQGALQRHRSRTPTAKSEETHHQSIISARTPRTVSRTEELVRNRTPKATDHTKTNTTTTPRATQPTTPSNMKRATTTALPVRPLTPTSRSSAQAAQPTQPQARKSSVQPPPVRMGNESARSSLPNASASVTRRSVVASPAMSSPIQQEDGQDEIESSYVKPEDRERFVLTKSRELETMWRQLGECSPCLDMLMAGQSPTGPAWPSSRQKWRLVVNHGQQTILVTTEGLSDPYAAPRTGPINGLGLEIFVEVPMSDLGLVPPFSPQRIKESWPYQLCYEVAQQAAAFGLRLKDLLTEMDVVSMELPITLNVPQKYRLANGHYCCLLGQSSAPWLPRAISVPLPSYQQHLLSYHHPHSHNSPQPVNNCPIRMVPCRLLSAHDAQVILQRAQEGRNRLTHQFTQDGSHHLCTTKN